MKVPSKEERKSDAQLCGVGIWTASMKALPKRKGNGLQTTAVVFPVRGLNESPSQKEGKSAFTFAVPVAACQPQ